mgnify:CR=1 FL=1
MFDYSNPDNVWSFVQAALVTLGFIFVVRQIFIAREQNSISHLIHFRTTWNAEPLLSARQKICEDYPKTDNILTPHDDLVAAFLEDLAAAIQVSHANSKHAWSYFSYYIEIYYAMLGPTIENYQSEIEATYFAGFKNLHRDFLGMSSGVQTVGKIKRLIEEERRAVEFRIVHS